MNPPRKPAPLQLPHNMSLFPLPETFIGYELDCSQTKEKLQSNEYNTTPKPYSYLKFNSRNGVQNHTNDINSGNKSCLVYEQLQLNH